MNDFHQRIIETRVKESNWRWIVKKIGYAIAGIAIAYLLFTVMFSSGSSNKETTPKPTFSMTSFDNIVDEHHVVGGEYEPTGYYRIICTNGHGHIAVNDEACLLAADEYIGKEHGSTVYAPSATCYLKPNDIVKVRNYHDTTFKLEFHYIGKTLEEE